MATVKVLTRCRIIAVSVHHIEFIQDLFPPAPRLQPLGPIARLLFAAANDVSLRLCKAFRAASSNATFPLPSHLQAALAAPSPRHTATRFNTLVHSFNSTWTSSGPSRRSQGRLHLRRRTQTPGQILTASHRTITALALLVSGFGYAGIISLSTYVFYMPFIFTTKAWPQLWRLLTAFLITKPKFAILMDPYFLYQYGSLLERESSRFSQPGDFFMYTAFVSAVIVVSTSTFLVVRVSKLRRIDTRLRLITSKYLPAQPTND
jgi:hypothetical protein